MNGDEQSGASETALTGKVTYHFLVRGINDGVKDDIWLRDHLMNLDAPSSI